MPELPEVETVCRGLNQLTLNVEIVGGEVLLDRTLASPLLVSDFWQGVRGTAIARWHRRGKYLLAALSSGGWLGVHLRMTGQLLWLATENPLQKHTRVRFFFALGRELRFIDQRTFGRVWWVPPGRDPASIISGLTLLGPEPFSPEFSPDYLARQLQKRQRPVKNALLDQAIVAGLGNIYADEALFAAGIRPTRWCNHLKRKDSDRLHQAILDTLQRAIAAGGTTFSSFLSVQGVNGNYGGESWVYNRTGQPCRVCGTPIERVKLAGRSCHFCGRCQK